MSGAAVELVTIGTELLLGHTVDGNAAWLGAALAERGIRLTRRTTVGDDEAAITSAVADALARSGVVICTGGLGPTRDDLTRPAVAALFDRPLVLDERWLDIIHQRFRGRGLTMPATNRVQAEVPRGARLLPNTRGTAPGLILEDPDRGTAILLPGVPREMRALVRDHVLPYLVGRIGAQRPIRSRTLRTTGISESALAERVADLVDDVAPLTVAFLPALTGEDVRFTSWGELDDAAADGALANALARFADRLRPWAYGADEADLAAIVGDRLRARGLTLAVAESCTGGLLAARLTNVAGASDYLLAGYVAYANEAKVALLGVRPETLANHGAVSEATVLEMAEAARRRAGAECTIAITGVAGPGGGTPEKPVGTIWIAAGARAGARARLLHLAGNRNEIRERAAQAALALLCRELEERP